jgi:beta-glucosidase
MTFSAEDVKMVASNISSYLIVIGIVLVMMIAVMIGAKKAGKPKRGFIRVQSAIAFLLAVVICVNMICLGKYKNTLNAALANNAEISEEAIAASKAVVQKVGEEGVVLAKNAHGVLPITDAKKLNVFGWASTNPLYGGSGSGASDSTNNISLLKGLENAGFSLNSELSDFYTEYGTVRPEAGFSVQDYTLPEPIADAYSSEMLSHAREFSDYAVIVISRVSGECFDLPTDMYEVIHNASFNPESKSIGSNGMYTNNGDYDDFEKGQSYLTLSKTERNMVELVCSNFENVIVVYNGAATMEMGWTEEYGQIKGVLLCAGTGSTGFNGLGEVVAGMVNPSGKTVDTWVYELRETPYFNNIGDFRYTNLGAYTAEIKAADSGSLEPGTFVNYNEGIYVGYKFYETAAAEGLIDYKKTVQYPFGYGLSYTTFEQKMGELNEDGDGNISFEVTVTNTGDRSGKDVVEVYYNPPYNNGGIEKASASLIEFAKTDLLKPGESQTIPVSFHKDDMAAFDAYGAKCYVLEAGDYGISIRSDSNTVLEEKILKVAADIVYDEANSRSSDERAAVSVFDYVEGHDSFDITYLSRKNGFANYEEAVKGPSKEQYTMSKELLATYQSNASYDYAGKQDGAPQMPVTGAKNGKKLKDLRGLSYDDGHWEALLDQLTVEEMVGLIQNGGWQTIAVASVGKVATSDCDGPAGLNNFMTQNYGTSFNVEVLLAQTWNKDLAYEVGEVMGQEFEDIRNYGWYAPAMDTHRSAFAGRNFEYFSEDGVLAGHLAAAEINGAATKGVYAYLKHYALNDQEINARNMLATWSTEQAVREIYLKPFEVAVKNFEGTAIGIMNSFNYIGTTWTGADYNLCTTVLRDEWGFRGMVITDYFGGYGYQNAEMGIYAGTDLMLNMVSPFAKINNTSATAVTAMRNAAKNILYTVVNSGAYSEEALTAASAMPGWQKTIYSVDAAVIIVLVVIEILAIRRYRKSEGFVVEETK